MIVTDARVICHLCGRALRSVTTHLRVHGYTKDTYCAVFGLERGQSLEGPDTRKLRAAALTSRLVFDAAIRAGSAAGRRRARSGELTRDAAAAATGRRHPEQRRRKARRARAGIPAELVAQANAERASRHLGRVAAEVATRHGYPDLGGRTSWPGRPAGPAWRRSAARPGCTRTGCPAISRTSPRRQPPRCQGSGQPGQTPGGRQRCTGSGSPTCPATCGSVTSGSTVR